MDEIEQRCSKTQLDEQQKKEQDAKSLLNNKYLNNSKKLDLFTNNYIKPQITNTTPSENGDTSDELDNYAFMQRNLRYVPEKYKSEAVELVKRLKNDEVIVLDKIGTVTLVGTNDKIPLVDFLRGVFQLKASVTRYGSFFFKSQFI